ncbi:hypothetical protein BMS3Bbin06_01621 [bacterium BMS3Bbin06]|nr:hypothetical protein BMS3Abin08_02508 [bacterium BMS3Abin08]GBE35085.1 hypothetical protein BMS3Bbin06_01621 [bacterium BMS3Bbin06]HDH00682.1 hypothetical protein [Nitrospirota bacterium]HDY72309.1 hypothetical protein [Nitrospirota bacterium]
MNVGTISKYLSPRVIAILLLQFLLLVVFLGYRAYQDTSVECVKCHGNKEKLGRLNAPWAFVTSEMVEKESHHPNIQCRDCHLGNGRAKDENSAHKGMLRMLIVGEDGRLLSRKQGYPGPLRMSGDDLMFSLMPKVKINGKLYMRSEVRNILWHDRDPKTLGFDPKIAEKTCGKKGCHPEELKQFRTTMMGRNYRQRTMRTWLKPYGPHNCGPSFADLKPPDVLKSAGFDYDDSRAIMKDLNLPFSKKQATDKQKFCNVCHAGCLDCHFTPSNKKGVHTFTKTPQALGCSGYGRGASTCHPGAMISRRGETYIGNDYSIPQGMKPDVHYKKGINCIDCHPTGEKGMGDMERKASCQDCHLDTESAHQRGIHSNMDCSTCHISELGGYQITIWGPGEVAEERNPFHKYSLYYGIQTPPIIMKDQKGKWMPVKVWPHSVGNIKKDVPPADKVRFRWPEGETRDAYYMVGTVDNLPANNKHLLWVEFEQAAHPFGKARTCDSCHSSETQVSESTWKFYDDDGSEPFSGKHTIIAGAKGLFFRDMKNTSPIKPYPQSKISDFASWIYLKDKWVVPGDFSIKADRKKYQKYKDLYNRLWEETRELDKMTAPLPGKIRKRYREVKAEAFHDLQRGKALIDGFKKETLKPPARRTGGE